MTHAGQSLSAHRTIRRWRWHVPVIVPMQLEVVPPQELAEIFGT
jgi:hypothetical protein